MRRKRARRRRTVKGAIWSLVLIAVAVGAVAVGAFAMLPPSPWRDVERAVRGHLGTLEETVGPRSARRTGLPRGKERSATLSGREARARWSLDRRGSSTARRSRSAGRASECTASTRRRAGRAAARGPALALRPGGRPGNGPPHRRAGGRVRGARPGPLRSIRRGAGSGART